LAAFDFDQAEAARAEGFEAIRGAETGDADAGFHGGAHSGGAGRDGHGLAVDLERDLCGGLARGRPVVDLFDERHGVISSRGVTGRSKSSAKWRRGLDTGYEIKPPRPQSDPSLITSSRSSSSSRFSVRSVPAMILSITSTPRVEPMRQGVHLPQLSIAQNSIAKRACWARSTASWKTPTPPCPSTPPRSAKDS